MTYVVYIIRKHEILSQSIKGYISCSQNQQAVVKNLFFWCREMVHKDNLYTCAGCKSGDKRERRILRLVSGTKKKIELSSQNVT